MSRILLVVSTATDYYQALLQFYHGSLTRDLPRSEPA